MKTGVSTGYRLRGVVATVVWMFAMAMISGCEEPADNDFQGYIEGEFLYISSPVGGQLARLMVERGDRVVKGDALFALEDESERLEVERTASLKQEAEARLENLRKGARPSELDAIRDRHIQAVSAVEFRRKELERKQELYAGSVIPDSELDQARYEFDSATALAASLLADLETAEMGGRSDEVKAAEAAVKAAGAAEEKALWVVTQKQQFAPVAGLVEDTYYHEGEWVGAGAPVVRLLPSDRVKVRFFVPETDRVRVNIGDRVAVHADGAESTVTAVINYLSPRAEYTPPVIYSRDTRSRLVYLVEAGFEPGDAGALSPGQPVDVTLEP
ncbi:MAG: HlyD family efflux transporter periplasmic adaptor subunit [Verrucomicrobia bacterium]|nr:HlyD family efflux transporter periplasmic adaptor subunit [Verrucomicrobiota bacterium]